MTETRDKAGEPGSGGEPATGPGTCPVVGIGASAGGVDALKRFFAAVDPDEALAYVVVQHLDPDHGSTLPQLIARVSKVPVKKITDDARIEPRHAYVIPPDATLTLEDGALRLGPSRRAARASQPDRPLLRLPRRRPGGRCRLHHPVRHRQRRHDRAPGDQGAWRARAGPGRCRV